MAVFSTISLCSSLASLKQKQKPNPCFNLSSCSVRLSPHKLPLCPLVSSSRRPAFPPAPKSSETEAAATANEEVPKRGDVFAVVMIGSRQYIVFPGRFIVTQRLKEAKVNDKIVLNKVLLVGTKAGTYIGKPVVTNAVVHAVVEEQGLDHKVIVFKYKRKKNYRRNIGHRQPNTRIRITGITGYEDFKLSTLHGDETALAHLASYKTQAEAELYLEYAKSMGVDDATIARLREKASLPPPSEPYKTQAEAELYLEYAKAMGVDDATIARLREKASLPPPSEPAVVVS